MKAVAPLKTWAHASPLPMASVVSDATVILSPDNTFLTDSTSPVLAFTTERRIAPPIATP